MSICQYLLIMGNENNKYENLTNKNSPQKANKNITKNNSSQYESLNFSKEKNNFQQKKPTRYATLFQWDGEGNNVYLTGSFCDWQQFFEMEKCEDPKNNKNHKFFITLFLPKGSYQYKFKIDDKWKCNSNFPTCSDKNGNINNIIDLTKQKREDGITDFSTSYVTTGGPEPQYDEMKNSKNSNSIQTIKNNFNSISNDLSIFTKSDIKNISANSSFKYNCEYDLNDYILNKNNVFDNVDINKLYDNSYKKAFPLKHEHIDHLIVNYNTFKKNGGGNKNLINSCSIRNGFKTTTIIYYKPKLKKG